MTALKWSCHRGAEWNACTREVSDGDSGEPSAGAPKRLERKEPMVGAWVGGWVVGSKKKVCRGTAVTVVLGLFLYIVLGFEQSEEVMASF